MSRDLGGQNGVYCLRCTWENDFGQSEAPKYLLQSSSLILVSFFQGSVSTILTRGLQTSSGVPETTNEIRFEKSKRHPLKRDSLVLVQSSTDSFVPTCYPKGSSTKYSRSSGFRQKKKKRSGRTSTSFSSQWDDSSLFR